jgi:hypothetical protein
MAKNDWERCAVMLSPKDEASKEDSFGGLKTSPTSEKSLYSPYFKPIIL